MTRLTVRIPATTADAVNAAILAACPDAGTTFTVVDPDDPTLMVASWDLTATGHDDLTATIAAAIEQTAKTGSGKTAKVAEIKAGPEPATATKIAAADLSAGLSADLADAKGVIEPSATDG